MTKYVNNNGVSEMWLNIKNWVTSQLLGYSQTGHTHTKSQITDLDLSNYVDKTSNQTVGGQKIFTSLFSKSRNLERGTLPTTNITEDPIFISLDKNNKRILAFYNYYYTNGTGRVSLYVYNPNTTDYDNIGLMFNFDNVNNNKSIQPNITNSLLSISLYNSPVCPKPPAPLSLLLVKDSLSLISMRFIVSHFINTICAILSPGIILMFSLLRLIATIPISPL